MALSGLLACFAFHDAADLSLEQATIYLNSTIKQGKWQVFMTQDEGGSILSSFQRILEGVEQLSTQKEESNDDNYADETRTGRGARFRC